MRCERVRIYSWTGNEVWECKGHTLPPPGDVGEPWFSPDEFVDYHTDLEAWVRRTYEPLDPTAES